MKIKSKEYRFRTSISEIINLVESRDKSFSKNIESILLEFLSMNIKIEYLERENQLIKEHNDTLNTIISNNQYHQVKDKKKTTKTEKEEKINLENFSEPVETLELGNDVKDSLKNMFDD